jgi:hypothetical protein
MGVRLGAVTLIASLGVAGLVACGGGGGDGGGSSTAPVTTAPVSTAPLTGAASGSTGPAGPSGASGGSAAAFCTKLQQAAVKLGDLGSAVTDMSKLKTALQDTVSYFEELDGSAPSELKPAIEDMVSGMKAAQRALADPSSADASALQQLATKISTDVNKLASYTNEHCAS